MRRCSACCPAAGGSEVAQHLPLLEQAVALLWQQLPAAAASCCRRSAIWRRWSSSWSPAGSVPVLVLEDRAERFDAYAASWLAIAASGTVSLEAALAGLPLITIYRPAP